MKKVLLTNYSFEQFTGSEIDTKTIASYFLKLKYDVTIFTFNYGSPLADNIDKRIKIIDSLNEGELEDEYDLCWAHHYPLLDYLIFGKKIKFKKIAYISLSSMEPLEELPAYYKELSYVSVLSKEAYEVFKARNIDVKNVYINGNYSFLKYFNKKKNNLSNQIKKICIVSNHVQSELVELRKICGDNKIQCDIFGKEFKYVNVDEKLLLKYDVVISIGKTVNYSLSLGIPTFVYDHFGGIGYLNKDNIEKANNYIFSGKCYRNIRPAEVLYKEIIEGYQECIDSIPFTYEFAKNNLCFEKNMSIILDIIDKKSIISMDSIINNYSNLNFLLYREMKKAVTLKNDYDYKRYQVYYDYGYGYNEEESYKNKYTIDSDNLSCSILIPNGVRKIRFDFTDQESIIVDYIKINDKNINLMKCNNLGIINGIFFTINNDPSIEINVNEVNSVKCNISLRKICTDDLIKISKKMEKDNFKLQQAICENAKETELNKELVNKNNILNDKYYDLEKCYNDIINSKRWKIINYIANFKKK